MRGQSERTQYNGELHWPGDRASGTQHAWDVVKPAFRGGTASLAKDAKDAVRFAHHILLAGESSLILKDQVHGLPHRFGCGSCGNIYSTGALHIEDLGRLASLAYVRHHSQQDEDGAIRGMWLALLAENLLATRGHSH